MRVLRANSTRSSTVPSFWRPADVGRRALLAAVVEHAEDADVGVALRGERLDQQIAALVGADHDGAAVEAALPRPLPHQQEQRAPKADQGQEPGDVERSQPYSRIVVADLGEEGHPDGDEEDHRPGGGEPEILLLVAAEGLHLVDVGGLEREHGERRDAENGPDIAPLEPFDGNDIAEIDGKTDHGDQCELEHAHRAGDHDRRPGRRGRLARRRRGRRATRPSAPLPRRHGRPAPRRRRQHSSSCGGRARASYA